uniref:Uncharacterized protein n=1 Tax=Nitzschia alba TaxID=2858 RepID=A0A5C0F473_NITAL|nr:hypothetical protein [Nitzschia alba]QEI59618.1 hypothetical protein [Nitzschia alba]
MSMINFIFTLADIDNAIFLILFIRFTFFTIQYNIKTAIYLTSIVLVTNFFWYSHLLDLLFFNSITLNSFIPSFIPTDFESDFYIEDTIIDKYYINPTLHYYIDPFSIFVSNLIKPLQNIIVPYYYVFYDILIPNSFLFLIYVWDLIGDLAIFILVIRYGRKYVPYFIRWHWIFLFLFGLIEKFYVNVCRRSFVYLKFCIFELRWEFGYDSDIDVIPNSIDNEISSNSSYFGKIEYLTIKVILLNIWIGVLIICHFIAILYGLFHSTCGQYLYFPYLSDNVDQHLPNRPSNNVVEDSFKSHFFRVYIL